MPAKSARKRANKDDDAGEDSAKKPKVAAKSPKAPQSAKSAKAEKPGNAETGPTDEVDDNER
jgi:hypothetical protein